MDLPRAARPPGEEALFTQPTHDRSIECDRVSPAIEGYFRIPAVWIGAMPAAESVRFLNPPVHHEFVYSKRMSCGIDVRVQRDGTFLFDFSAWPLAPMVTVPGYRKPSLDRYVIPAEHVRAEEKAEAYAVLRAQVMNVHQACFTTAERLVKGRGAMTGFPVTAWNTLKAWQFDEPKAYWDDVENMHALAHNVLNNKDHVLRNRALGRRVIELEVVERSFDLLDQVLKEEDAGLIQLIEAAYIAGCRQRDKRFGEAVVLGWGVCEQLVSIAWNCLIADKAHWSADVDRMPKERREKLVGRDFTASMVVEMLEVNGRIDHKLYRLLEIARKARNNWAHKMRPPREREVSVCMSAIETLFAQTKGLRMALQSGGRGGVPLAPIWEWERIKSMGGL